MVGSSKGTRYGDYDAMEVGENGNPGGGYLAVQPCDVVRVMGKAARRHAANRSWLYAFGHKSPGIQGWFPISCLKSIPFLDGQASMAGSMYLGSHAGRRNIQYISSRAGYPGKDPDSKGEPGDESDSEESKVL